MKAKFFIPILVMLLVLAVSLHAQTPEEARVKILPTVTPGIIKVFYAQETSEPLQVKFIAKDGILRSDKIEGGPYPNGVSKRYDVRKINNNDFWIEVSSSRMTVTYHIVPSKDRKTFTPYLEKTTYNQVLVKANN